MKKTDIGYIYSGKIGKNEESFIRLANEKNAEITFLDASKDLEEKDLINLQKCDIIFNDSGYDFAYNILKIFEDMGKLVVESTKAIRQENKWNTYKICKQNNIPTPRTVLLSNDLEIAKIQLNELNEWPIILKRVKGTWGEYVEKVNNIEEALETIKKFWEKGKEKLPIIAQEFIDSFSYRVTYINNEIVQTTIKENNNWKCTGVYARSFKKFKVDLELEEIIKKIIQNFDIKICGVDFLKKNGKWSVIEVNTEPALDFFEDEREKIIEKIIDLLIQMTIKEKNLNLIEIAIEPNINKASEIII
jgi:glutathione synthase/RimK-type ligase-like ATP-grasp enzyme